MSEKQGFIDELKAYAEAEDILVVEKEVKELRTKFSDFVMEEERLHQVAQLEALEKGESTKPYYDALNDTFFELYTTIRERQKEQRKIQKTTEAECLKQKQILLDQLKHVIENEENIGEAFNSLKTINEKWKTIGDIPRDKRHEIQQEYSRLRELFSYNIKIYKELKEHDLHRNKQLKEKVIAKLAVLLSEAESKGVKTLEKDLKVLQEEWEEIGPTLQSDWDVLKEAYWTKIRDVYTLIRGAYEAKKETMAENIVLKKQLIEKAQQLLGNIENIEKHSVWQKLTEKLLEIQEEWKKVGYGTKAENEQVWVDFRAVCDAFFEKKKAFYDERKSEFGDVRKVKEDLIEAINKIKDSTDWKTTSNEIIALQKQWKNAGSAGPKHEKKLWAVFRGACDEFFNNKAKHFESLEGELNENLVKKQAVIESINAYKIKDDKKATLEDLKGFINAYNAAGKVPFKEKDTVYKAFKEAIDVHYKSLDMKGEEKEKVMFQIKVDTLKSDPNADKLLQQEKRKLQHEIQKIKNEVIQLENNIGFFGRSKGAEKLKQEVEKKIETAKEGMKKLEIKLKQLSK